MGNNSVFLRLVHVCPPGHAFSWPPAFSHPKGRGFLPPTNQVWNKWLPLRKNPHSGPSFEIKATCSEDSSQSCEETVYSLRPQAHATKRRSELHTTAPL